MGRKVYKKRETATSVYDAALARINDLYDRFDRVVVSFSGGKDSTVCLNLALQVARERGRLPLDVFFFDEEAIHPETVAYVERISRNPDIALKWLCVSIQHRNACSRKEPYWYPWHAADRARWVRPLPAGAITELPGMTHGQAMPEVTHLVYGNTGQTIAEIRGIRADESMRRYQSVASKLTDNWISAGKDGFWFPTSPIYDWTTIDVWTAPLLFGWDYNRTYDVMRKAGVAPSVQRVCPPFGEEPLRGLWLYAVCWPDLWHKMVNRVHGAATAARYAKSEVYGFGKIAPPPGLTWREWTFRQLELYPEEHRSVIAENIRSLMRQHKNKTMRPIPESEPDLMSGISWQFLAMIVNRGDLKGRRAQNAIVKANNEIRKRGMSLYDVLEMESDCETRY